jgi:shikimate dehydrogenase
MQEIPSLTEFLAGEQVRSPFATVLGNPISHSLSPMIHNAALKKVEFDAKYHAVCVGPQEHDLLPSLFGHTNFVGSNVTLPLKSKVIEYLDVPETDVILTGACNTVWVKKGKIHGANTDINGFLSPLIPHSADIRGSSAIVFGTGGASKAVIFALQKLMVSQIVVVSRSPQAQAGKNIVYSCYEDWPKFVADTKILVNCTPLGMYPNTDQSPIGKDFDHLLKDKICYDIVYRPIETHFLSQAKRNGGIPINGTAMFLGQAADAFTRFTGKDFPHSHVTTILHDFLNKSV